MEEAGVGGPLENKIEGCNDFMLIFYFGMTVVTIFSLMYGTDTRGILVHIWGY